MLKSFFSQDHVVKIIVKYILFLFMKGKLRKMSGSFKITRSVQRKFKKPTKRLLI